MSIRVIKYKYYMWQAVRANRAWDMRLMKYYRYKAKRALYKI